MTKKRIEDQIIFEKGQYSMAEKFERLFPGIPEVLRVSQRLKEKHYTGLKRLYKELENEETEE